MIGVLPSKLEERDGEVDDGYFDGSFIRLPVLMLLLLHQKLLSCEQLSIPTVSTYSFCNQTTVTTIQTMASRYSTLGFLCHPYAW
jgi:hypothetical protein